MKIKITVPDEEQKAYLRKMIINHQMNINFRTNDGKLKTTYAQMIKSKKLKVELAPDYIYEILNIALGHDYFYINGVRYNTEEGIEIERQGETRLYPLEVVLRVVEDAQGNAYEDYSVNQPITGTLPIIPPFGLWAEEGKALWAETGKAIGYY